MVGNDRSVWHLYVGIAAAIVMLCAGCAQLVYAIGELWKG